MRARKTKTKPARTLLCQIVLIAGRRREEKQKSGFESKKGRIPRVFCDEFVTKFVTKFGDKYSESPNIVINYWTKLVTNAVRNCIL